VLTPREHDVSARRKRREVKKIKEAKEGKEIITPIMERPREVSDPLLPAFPKPPVPPFLISIAHLA
jgi:hypothetical protein